MSPRTTPAALPSDALFAAALRRLRRKAGLALGGPALAGALVTSTPFSQAGCSTAPELDETEQAGWVEAEGQRNPAMVSYLGDFWSECRTQNTRFGCGDYMVFVKLRVKPQTSVDLSYKRVGVVFKSAFDRTERTAVGSYFGRLPNGDEEWHVPISLPNYQRTILFSAWYQDGGSHTYFDDNQGEWHAVNDGPAQNVVRVEPWTSTVAVDGTGVVGSVSVQVSDLDFDKEIALIGSTDGWLTQFELKLGKPGDKNAFYWTEDYPWSDMERWQIDLYLPGDFQRVEYAVVYRHGVVNGARRYEFWDNNGGMNYAAARVAQ